MGVHPGVAQRYRAEIDRIAEALGDGHERGLAVKMLRGLIDKVADAPD